MFLALVQGSSHTLPGLGSFLFLIGNILVVGFLQEFGQSLDGAILLPVVLPLILVPVKSRVV